MNLLLPILKVGRWDLLFWKSPRLWSWKPTRTVLFGGVTYCGWLCFELMHGARDEVKP